jgi:anti-anti-sigma regulatory factor
MELRAMPLVAMPTPPPLTLPRQRRSGGLRPLAEPALRRTPAAAPTPGTQARPRPVVVSPMGPVDGDRLRLLRRRLAMLSSAPGTPVVVDLRCAGTPSAAVVQLLADARSRLTRTGGSLRVEGVGSCAGTRAVLAAFLRSGACAAYDGSRRGW